MTADTLWRRLGFGEAFLVVGDQGKRVPQRSYLPDGVIPVIDQGASYIGGFTNDASMTYEGPLPVLVFGDHTRRVKFVDQRFAVGADGVKLLHPSGHLDPKFAYYLLLRSVKDIRDRGYSRHFQFLRALTFQVPEVAHQRRIVAAIDEYVSHLNAAETLMGAVQDRLRTFLGAIWHSSTDADWPELPLSQLLELRGGDPLRQGWSPRCERHARADDTHWGVLKTTAIQFGRFDEAENKALPASLKPRPEIEVGDGDFLMTSGGPRARIGVTCIARSPRRRLMASDKMFIFRPDRNLLDPEFLLSYLTSMDGLRRLGSLKTGSNDSGLRISQRAFTNMRVPVPPLPVQHGVVSHMTASADRLTELSRTLSIATKRSESLRTAILAAAFAGRLISTESGDVATESSTRLSVPS